jgi:hypothetical protein
VGFQYAAVPPQAETSEEWQEEEERNYSSLGFRPLKDPDEGAQRGEEDGPEENAYPALGYRPVVGESTSGSSQKQGLKSTAKWAGFVRGGNLEEQAEPARPLQRLGANLAPSSDAGLGFVSDVEMEEEGPVNGHAYPAEEDAHLLEDEAEGMQGLGYELLPLEREKGQATEEALVEDSAKDLEASVRRVPPLFSESDPLEEEDASDSGTERLLDTNSGLEYSPLAPARDVEQDRNGSGFVSKDQDMQADGPLYERAYGSVVLGAPNEDNDGAEVSGQQAVSLADRKNGPADNVGGASSSLSEEKLDTLGYWQALQLKKKDEPRVSNRTAGSAPHVSVLGRMVGGKKGVKRTAGKEITPEEREALRPLEPLQHVSLTPPRESAVQVGGAGKRPAILLSRAKKRRLRRSVKLAVTSRTAVRGGKKRSETVLEDLMAGYSEEEEEEIEGVRNDGHLVIGGMRVYTEDLPQQGGWKGRGLRRRAARGEEQEEGGEWVEAGEKVGRGGRRCKAHSAEVPVFSRRRGKHSREEVAVS